MREKYRKMANEAKENSFNRSKFSPSPFISQHIIPSGIIHIVRDDMLKGGTKQRAIIPYLRSLKSKGYKTFVYASPFSGFAQVALASGCQDLNLECILYCEQDQTTNDQGVSHKFTKLALSMGAKVLLTKNLDEAESLASLYVLETNPKALKLPLGFDCSEYKFHLKQELSLCWKSIVSSLPSTKNIWLPVGSGTLAQIFREIIPKEVKLRCVNIRVLDEDDPRVIRITQMANTDLQKTPERFADLVIDKPEIPSNEHYDSKLWQFIKNQGRDQDLWWNVAK